LRSHILAFILLASVVSFAQEDPLKNRCENVLEGKVLDEHDKSPLEFANLFILELNKSAFTNEKGYYKFEGLCAGIYTIRINHLNCEPIEEKVEVRKNTRRNFTPEHHAELLKGVDITTEKITEQTTQTKSDITAEKLEQYKGQSLGETLKNVPGVASLNTGNSISKPIIHGMHSNRILILNNGIRQEGQQWGVEHAPEVDPFIANKISVVKGANSVRYGSDAIAGVVLMETKPLRDSAGMNGELNLIGATNGRGGTASGFVEGNLKKLSALSWRVQGTVKQNGNISSPNYILVNTGVKENNFSYALGWNKTNYGIDLFYSQFNTSIGIFSASHIGNLTDLQRAFDSNIPLETGSFTYKIARPYQHIEHELFKVSAFVRTGNTGKLTFTYARQHNLRFEYDKHGRWKDSLASVKKPELSLEITSHTGDLIWEHNRIKNLSGSIGISGVIQGNTYDGRFLIPNFRNYNGGFFWIERWKKNRIELEGGVRYDYKWMQVYKYDYIGNASYVLVSPILIFQNTTGNLGAIFKKDSTLNFSLNVGTAWRAPTVNELYTSGLHHGAAAIEYGNDSLRPEKAYTAIFTTRYSIGNRIYLEISPYANLINDFIFREPSKQPILSIQGAFPGFYYKQTNATLTGCDFFLNYKIFGNFELTSKASWLRARNQKTKDWLIMMPSDRYEAELTYRFRDTKYTYSSYISSSVMYVTKQWRVPANVDFAEPPSAYYTFNLHAASSIYIGRQKVELGISVFNLFDQAYRDYLDRFRYFTDAMGRNFVLRLKVPFNALKKIRTKKI
jgi:iron complex outermembrane recepter protein